MATVLFAWELGSGLGHVARIEPVATRLVQKGHRVFCALRHLSRAVEMFGESGVACLQAPAKFAASPSRTVPSVGYADLLTTIGFGDHTELKGLVNAWRHLFSFVKPDVIVFDHSPTAFVAASGLGAKRVQMGTGFACPPADNPLPTLRPWVSVPQEHLTQTEATVVASVNRLLRGWGTPEVAGLGPLFAQADETILATFPELDHYPSRQGARYLGVWSSSCGELPVWPSGVGGRVFAYLRPFPALPAVVDVLARSGWPTVLYAPEMDSATRDLCRTRTIHTANRPVDLAVAAAQCDVAVLNAGHGTTAALLLAGKPVVALPTTLEQLLTARSVERLGAGVVAPTLEPERVGLAVEQGLQTASFGVAARAFAARYAAFDPTRQIEVVVARLEELLSFPG